MEKKIRAVFIADSEGLRSLALQVLADAGVDVYVAERETVALDDIVAWQPDVVVVDPRGRRGAVRQPFEVALELRHDSRVGHVPVVVLGDSWTLWQYENEVQMLKPAATLPLPFAADELVDAVRGACRPRAGGGGGPQSLAA